MNYKHLKYTIKFYLSPFFANNFLLLKSIKLISSKYKIERDLLDIGCGQKPYAEIFSNIIYKGIDCTNYSRKSVFMEMHKPDYFFDEKYFIHFNLPFKDEEFSNAASFQVLEHHENPQKMIHEMVRITKKNGYIILSAPFFWCIHEEPNDFYRFTRFGLLNLLKKEKVEIIEIIPQGSFFVIISTLINSYIFENKNKLFLLILLILLYVPCQVFQYASIILDRFFDSNRFTLNYVIVAKKK